MRKQELDWQDTDQSNGNEKNRGKEVFIKGRRLCVLKKEANSDVFVKREFRICIMQHWGEAVWIGQLATCNGAWIMTIQQTSYPSSGETPLLYAAESGNITIVNLLLAAGAHPNISDNNGVTPLHRAALYGFKEMVERLLEMHVDINCKTVHGETPLMYALENHHNDIAQLLIDVDADLGCNNTYPPAVASHKNYTALHIAVYYANEPMIILLAPRFGIDLTTPGGKEMIEGIRKYVKYQDGF